jgi:hypothetical protein
MYMHASPWSRLPKNCFSSLSFGHSFVESKGSLRYLQWSKIVPIVNQTNSVYTLLPYSIRPF